MLSIPDALKSIPDLPAKLVAEFEAIGKLPPEEGAEALGRALGKLGFELVPVTEIVGGAAKALKVTRIVKGAGRVTKALKFGGSGAVVHFGKHGKSLMDALGKKSYKLADYLRDANHVLRHGTYVPELNGYVKLIGGQGSAKYGFVGVNRATGNITTFHIKTAKELSKKAPSLGINF